jgi:hypothetical protein
MIDEMNGWMDRETSGNMCRLVDGKIVKREDGYMDL